MNAEKRTWTTQDEANTYSTYEVLLLRSVRTLEHLGKITAQRDALAEALRFCVKALEVEAPIYRAHIDEARAALALADGAR